MELRAWSSRVGNNSLNGGTFGFGGYGVRAFCVGIRRRQGTHWEALGGRMKRYHISNANRVLTKIFEKTLFPNHFLLTTPQPPSNLILPLHLFRSSSNGQVSHRLRPSPSSPLSPRLPHHIHDPGLHRLRLAVLLGRSVSFCPRC